MTNDNTSTSTTDNELKLHISRIPQKFTEETVLRILTEQLLVGDHHNNDDDPPKIQIELIYPREEETKEDEEQQTAENNKVTDKKKKTTHKEGGDDEAKTHRGFGFATFQSQATYDKAIAMATIKGGRKPTSKKLYTMYLRPYTTVPTEMDQCYLWSKRRCPYGEECKFTHSGPGACLPTSSDNKNASDDEAIQKKKRGKCFAYKKGKCTKGDDCPFSHDFEPKKLPSSKAESSSSSTPTPTPKSSIIPQSEKDCINWKTKGKCRKGDKCPYRHDPELLTKALAKKKNNKRSRNDDNDDQEDSNAKKQKQKQPLCIRVFGMAYDTTEDDIRAFFQDCGKIQDVRFPTFEDSGRSKGYCGIWFASPKAVSKALELNEQELLGRWLSVQVGKMYLKEWEANHSKSFRDDNTGEEVSATFEEQ